MSTCAHIDVTNGFSISLIAWKSAHLRSVASVASMRFLDSSASTDTVPSNISLLLSSVTFPLPLLTSALNAVLSRLRCPYVSASNLASALILVLPSRGLNPLPSIFIEHVSVPIESRGMKCLMFSRFILASAEYAAAVWLYFPFAVTVPRPSVILISAAYTCRSAFTRAFIVIFLGMRTPAGIGASAVANPKS